MKYIINYNNGSPERNTADTLEEAMRIADENVCFSGSMNGITIEDEDGNSIMRRRWYGIKYDENNPDLWCENPICFGSEGYLGGWYELPPMKEDDYGCMVYDFSNWTL